MRKNTARTITTAAALLCLLPVAGCSHKEAKVTTLDKQKLTADTTWSGTVIVNGDIYVPPGVTLTVLPGTTVKFKRIDETSDQNLFGIESPYYPEAELIVRGRLLAKGTEDDVIVFTSAEVDARPKDWGAINFLGADGSVIDHCKILFAYNGVHAHGSAATVTNSEIAKCGVGVSFKKEEETKTAPWFGKTSKMVVTHNRITNNKGGVGFRNAGGLVAHNLIEDNKFFGIFAKENSTVEVTANQITGSKKGVYLYQARGIKVHGNNIYDNADYNVAVAEAQDYDLDFSGNWFGTINPARIDEKIFDKKDDSDLGAINYLPFLKARVDWEKD